jgi:ABC-2 type transport system ATP-binding protein
MTSPTLEAVGLSKRYGNFSALTNLNLKIDGAKCVGFLGPNGAGKTTTLKIFTDLIFRTSGKALINGVDVHENKKKALATTAALVETPEIYPALTPKEALLLIAEHRGVPTDMRKKKIDEALREVRMEEWKDKRVGKFSKGMKQRINVASTLLSDPEIILLDEPTSGLDPRGMTEVRGIVKNLKKQNRLIFMSSHLLPEVSEICDEVAIIDHGKLLVYDTLPNVTMKFSGNGRRKIIEIAFSRPISDLALVRKIEAASGVISLEQTDSMTMRITIDDEIENQERLQSELAMMKIGMISFRPLSSPLENVYLNLIKDTL